MHPLWEKESFRSILVDNWLEIIRQYIMARGYTLTALADKAGLSRRVMHEVVNGTLKSRETLEKITRALEINLESLFKEKFKKKNDTD